MNLSKKQIDTLISVGDNGDNGKSSMKISSNNLLKSRLIEGKMLVDRWGGATEIIVFNTAHKKFVHDHLMINNDYYIPGYVDHIWGADIIYSEHMPENKILCLSNSDRLNEIMDPALDKDDDNFDCQIDNGRAIAVLPMVNYE